MKKLLILFYLFPSILMAQTNGLSLAEVRVAVLSGNPSVRESLQRIVIADALLKQARAAYLPTISFKGSYGAIDTSLHPDFSPGDRYTDSFKEGRGGLQGTWPLFDGFARKARALGAQYNVQRTQDLADETRRLLILSATVSFRQAQLAKENIQIAEQDNNFNTKLEEDARKRFKAGSLPEADVQNFTIRALQAESAYLRSKLNYAISCTVLAELMAFPEATLPEEMHPKTIAFSTPVKVPSLEGEFQYALSHRPDYKAIQSGQLAVEQQVRAAKGDLLPQVALVGGINYTDREGLSTVGRHGNYDSFVGVAAQWDLFAGGRKVNTVKQAQAEMRALEEQRESLRLAIRSSLRQRIDGADTAQSIFERQEKIYRLSANVRNSVEKSYKAGMTSITRLNEAQTDLVRAKGEYSTAFIAYLLSLNQIDIETGRVLDGI